MSSDFFPINKFEIVAHKRSKPVRLETRRLALMQFISSVYLAQNVQIEFLNTNSRPRGFQALFAKHEAKPSILLNAFEGGYTTVS